ncbi:MAG: carboxylating nicotinate-nucleotide diphosphorylase, partial [Burkholderiales bacterium]
VGTGDATAALIPEGSIGHARVIARERAVVCGVRWCEEVFHHLDPLASLEWHARDGDLVRPDQAVCEIRGQARSLLTGERTALNFLQMLSAVATQTRRFVDAVAGTSAAILDTRKTIPGLRHALKYAVRTGGGRNHRMGLYDGVLIKENHIHAAGGIPQVMDFARQMIKGLPIQIEVESIEQLQQAIECGGKLILLDNFDLNRLEEAVHLTAGRAELEASGGITLDNVRAVAQTGVDRISVGALTKDVRAINLSMRFVSL